MNNLNTTREVISTLAEKMPKNISNTINTALLSASIALSGCAGGPGQHMTNGKFGADYETTGIPTTNRQRNDFFDANKKNPGGFGHRNAAKGVPIGIEARQKYFCVKEYGTCPGQENKPAQQRETPSQ